MGLLKFLKETIKEALEEPPKEKQQISLEQILAEDPGDKYGLKKMIVNDKKADKEIEDLNNAYGEYKEDKDIDKCIAVYERCIHSGVLWNKKNFAITLVKLYMDNHQNNKAWGLLNQMIVDKSIIPDPMAELTTIRYWQYKILKQEGKNVDALRMLVLSRLTPVPGFDTKKFIQEYKSLLKETSITEEEFTSFLNMLTYKAKRTTLTEDTVIKQFDITFKNKN